MSYERFRTALARKSGAGSGRHGAGADSTPARRLAFQNNYERHFLDVADFCANRNRVTAAINDNRIAKKNPRRLN